jgi:hypothetical protein
MLLEGSVYALDLTDTNALVLLSDSKIEHTYYDYHGSENTENSGVQLIQEAVIPPSPLLPLNSRAKSSRSTYSVPAVTMKLELAMRADSIPKHAEPPFEPCYFFFYGSLMDPEVLQVVSFLGFQKSLSLKTNGCLGFL